MQTSEKKPLILTVRLDPDSQAYFDAQRKRYFPAEFNMLNAHLTLFHQLSDESATYNYLSDLNPFTFELCATGLMNLGAGVAYRIESSELNILHQQLRVNFFPSLIPQDRQVFRPHITVMNKSTPEHARALYSELSFNFEPFKVKAIGLDLWVYLDGPWRHERSFLFGADNI